MPITERVKTLMEHFFFPDVVVPMVVVGFRVPVGV